MKRLLLLLTFLLTPLTCWPEQAKRVYITLDVSGSMEGAKYVLANYTTQMLVTLCDDDDEVSLIVTGRENNLSKTQNPLKLLQHPLGEHRNPLLAAGADRDEEIRDIITFNRLYRPSKDRQDWAFIIGDGNWSVNQDNAAERLGKIVKQGTLNVCHLQTGVSQSEWNDFAQAVEKLGVVDISKSDLTPASIKAGCDHFARKILGFSEVPMRVKAEGRRGLTMTLELPVKEFYLVYQDEVAPAQLPNISSVQASGFPLKDRLKGTPTTLPLVSGSGREAVKLSGHVWRVTSGSTLPAGTEIEVQFDKDMALGNVCVYPVVEGIEPGTLALTRVGGTLQQLDDHTYSICRDERKATVKVELSGASAAHLPEGLLKQTRVVVKSGNKSYDATYRGGVFECEIPLTGEETAYYAECDCPGYFKRVTSIMTIVKGDCPPVKPAVIPEDVRPTAHLGTISFDVLKNENLQITIQDKESLRALDPTLFDISFEVENDFLYEEPKFHIENDTVIVLELHPYGDWCECLFPEGLNLKMISTPRDEAFQEYEKNYQKTIFPMHMDVVKNRPWLSRCLWVLLTLAGLLLLAAYLRGLLKKNRFHKRARLKNSYYVEDNPKEVQKGGKPLRQPGFGPWLNRWLNPFGDERMSTSFVRPKTGAMTFIASESKNRILMTEASFDEKRMTVPNYQPQPREGRKKEGKPISITSGTSIEIKKVQSGETTRLGHLKYIVEGPDDEGAYRMVVGLLFGLTVVALLALLWQMLRGLF